MGRFNTKSSGSPSKSVMKKIAKTSVVTSELTVNQAGGEAYSMTDRGHLASLALTAVLSSSTVFASGSSELTKIKTLVARLVSAGDAEFVAKVAWYARYVHGMRTVSHVLAGEIALLLTNDKVSYPWRHDFMRNIIRRPDDATEIMAYIMANSANKKVPNAAKRGIGEALARFPVYSLSKYRGEGKGLKLCDVVNICHPRNNKKVDAKDNALSMLMKGTIPPANTWEHQISEAGKDENPDLARTKAWKTLFKENQIGIMAAIMNIRQIAEKAPDAIDLALAVITDPEQNAKNLMLPSQFISAYAAIKGATIPRQRDILNALEKAADLALHQVPRLDGKTLICLDASGSMNSGATYKQSPFELGALFASSLYCANPDADFLYFEDHTHPMTFGKMGVLSTHENMVKSRTSGGTNFQTLFLEINKAYDRIIVLSDMQAWETTGEWNTSNPKAALQDYRDRTGADPVIFTWDLKSSGTCQFKDPKVCYLSGWSKASFGLIPKLEKDRNALISEVEAVTQHSSKISSKNINDDTAE